MEQVQTCSRSEQEKQEELCKKYKLAVWRNWKIAVSSPIFIAPVSETDKNWATEVKHAIIRSEVPFVIADKIEKNWDRQKRVAVTYMYIGIALPVLLILTLILFCVYILKKNKTHADIYFWAFIP